MSDIQLITKLRELTGAGMMDCKAALAEAGDDFDKAVELMRKKGEAKAAKKADRATREGVVAIAKAADKVAVVGVACETDFVAINPDFVAAVQDYAAQLLTMGEADFKPWAEEKIAKELIVKIGENLKLVESRIIDGAILGTYLHSNKKAAAVVVLDGGTAELANDLSMQVVAMSPEYLNPEAVPAELVTKEKEIYIEQLKAEGKPEAMFDKIIPGKLNKFYSDVCLTKQAFIKDDKQTIEKLLESAKAKILTFTKFQI